MGGASAPPAESVARRSQDGNLGAGRVGVRAGHGRDLISRHLDFSDVEKKYQPGKYDDAKTTDLQVVGYSLGVAALCDRAIIWARATTSAGPCFAPAVGPVSRRRIQRASNLGMTT